jgi:predicted GNAT superfamily acetyltransferase
LLQSFARAGGAVIGAFDGPALVGCVFGYVGLSDDGMFYHRSQRLAVLPAYQGRGLGEALKRAQAAHALAHGLRLMCWTFDPLRARNAHLNLHKLGAMSRMYLPDAYAALSSARDAGAPIDRLWVEWALDTPQAGRSLSGLDAASIALRNNADRPADLNVSIRADVALIQIPDDIDAVRARDAGLARAWREATRQAFTAYFARGFQVVDFIRRRGYVLTTRLSHLATAPSP